MASETLYGDDTPVPVLAPGSGRTKTGRLWTYVRDERPYRGARPPAAVFFYSPDRKGEHPRTHLEPFTGVLHADGYAGFNGLFETGRISEAGCWAYVRRKFFDVYAATTSPIAKETLERNGQLYAVEKTINGSPPAAASAQMNADHRGAGGLGRGDRAQAVAQIRARCSLPLKAGARDRTDPLL